MDNTFAAGQGLKSQAEVLAEIINKDFGGVGKNETTMQAAARILLDQQTKLAQIQQIIGIPEQKPLPPESVTARMAILLNNITREIGYLEKATAGATNAGSTAVILSLCTGFITEHGPALFGDPAYHMNGPVTIINDVAVSAMTRKLTTRYRHNLTSKQRAIDEAYASIVAEFEAEIAELAKAGKVICPYVPLTSSGVFIDPETYEPVITFMTRYGVMDRPE